MLSGYKILSRTIFTLLALPRQYGQSKIVARAGKYLLTFYIVNPSPQPQTRSTNTLAAVIASIRSILVHSGQTPTFIYSPSPPLSTRRQETLLHKIFAFGAIVLTFGAIKLLMTQIEGLQNWQLDMGFTRARVKSLSVLKEYQLKPKTKTNGQVQDMSGTFPTKKLLFLS